LRVVIAHLQHEPNVWIGQRIAFDGRVADRQMVLDVWQEC
jgi:hypothetical protein